MQPLPPDEGRISQAHTSGIFLEKPGLLKEALRRSREWDRAVPGGSPAEVRVHGNTLEESLLRLKEEQRAEERVAAQLLAGKDDEGLLVDPNDDGRLIVTDAANGGVSPAPSSPRAEEEFEDEEERAAPGGAAATAVTPNVQKADESSPGIVKQGESRDPVVVFVRHGRTPHNNLGLFTG